MSQRQGFRATPELMREIERNGTATFDCGRYCGTIVRVGTQSYEAWTDSLPFIYGRPAATPQGALDNLEASVREAEGQSRAS